jgi:hypothetical protein
MFESVTEALMKRASKTSSRRGFFKKITERTFIGLIGLATVGRAVPAFAYGECPADYPWCENCPTGGTEYVGSWACRCCCGNGCGRGLKVQVVDLFYTSGDLCTCTSLCFDSGLAPGVPGCSGCNCDDSCLSCA